MDQVYVRSKKNAEPLIMLGKKLGYKCGGKKEVLGAIVPKEKTGSFYKGNNRIFKLIIFMVENMKEQKATNVTWHHIKWH